MNFKDKVVFITGGGSGIGRAAALGFLRAGAFVGICSRGEDSLRAVVSEAAQNGEDSERMVILPADVSNPEEIEGAINQLVEKHGRLDVVFANAGSNGTWAPIEELEADDWDKTMAINLKGTFLTTKYAIPHLKKNGGAIVITASVNGTRIFSNAGATAYSCSKAGQVAFAKMAALELAQFKIRVNVICPGAIDTNIESSTHKHDTQKIEIPVIYPHGSIPLTGGTPGTSDEVAQLAMFLASDGAAHITGTEIWIDGAESLLQG